MLSILRSLISNRRLLADFVVRDLRARYVGSSMGFFWSVIFPVINLVVYYFVFRMVLGSRWSDAQGPLEVALVMLAGIVVWQAFAETIIRSTGSLVDNANLIQKVVFPSELLPAYLAKSSLVNMLIGLPVLLLAVGFFGHVYAPATQFQVAPVPAPDGSGELVHPAFLTLGEAGDPLHLPLTLERGYAQAIEVELEYSGAAVRGEDFLAPDRVVIPPRSRGGVLSIQPLLDTDASEGEERFTVRIASVSPGRVHEVGETPASRRSVEVALMDGPVAAPGAAASSAGGFEAVGYDEEYRPLRLSWPLLAVPVLLLVQFLYTIGLGYLLAVLNAFVRDTYHLVGVGITVWMFCTPIFYPPVLVASKGFGWLLAINPMHWLIDCWRSVLLYGDWPDPWHLARFFLAGIVMLALGGRFFMSQRTRIPDLL